MDGRQSGRQPSFLSTDPEAMQRSRDVERCDHEVHSSVCVKAVCLSCITHVKYDMTQAAHGHGNLVRCLRQSPCLLFSECQSRQNFVWKIAFHFMTLKDFLCEIWLIIHWLDVVLLKLKAQCSVSHSLHWWWRTRQSSKRSKVIFSLSCRYRVLLSTQTAKTFYSAGSDERQRHLDKITCLILVI